MKKPNIIVIMTDDQGYGDLSCMGSQEVVTPNFDSLADSGTRFGCMYANSPVCSPSRAALLTGRYPGYAGVRSILAGHRTATGLTDRTPTVATALKQEGYDTALIGKWHLGLAQRARPNQNGFDYFYGFMAGCIDYYSHIFYWGMADGKTNPCHDLWENDREVYQNGTYFTDLITERAVAYIREKSGEETPFFLYLGYNAPHYPMHAPEKYMKRFAHLPWDRQVMAAMISGVDDGIGAIRDELTRCGVLEDTIIYFQSDNGPSRESRNFLDGREDPYYGGSSGHFKGHKYSLFEGGIRVPAMISWPGRIPAGQVLDTPVASMDIFPTLLEAAGGEAAGYALDGKSIMDTLFDPNAAPHEAIFWEMDRQTAIRKGDYKLVLHGVLEEEGDCDTPLFLSNLRQDPGERENLSETLPEVAEALEKEALAWRAQLEEFWENLEEKAI